MMFTQQQITEGISKAIANTRYKDWDGKSLSDLIERVALSGSPELSDFLRYFEAQLLLLPPEPQHYVLVDKEFEDENDVLYTGTLDDIVAAIRKELVEYGEFGGWRLRTKEDWQKISEETKWNDEA